LDVLHYYRYLVHSLFFDILRDKPHYKDMILKNIGDLTGPNLTKSIHLNVNGEELSMDIELADERSGWSSARYSDLVLDAARDNEFTLVVSSAFYYGETGVDVFCPADSRSLLDSRRAKISKD
jgi:hypothetical protein